MKEKIRENSEKMNEKMNELEKKMNARLSVLEPLVYEINKPEPDISTLTPCSVVSADISNESAGSMHEYIPFSVVSVDISNEDSVGSMHE